MLDDSTDPSGYGRTLKGGLTVIFLLAGVFLLVCAVASSIGQAGNREKDRQHYPADLLTLTDANP